MPRLKYTTTARDSLVAIRRYLALESQSFEVGQLYVQHLRKRCRTIAQYEHLMGRARPELGEGLRSIAEGNYVLIFRYVGDWLEIVDIIEGHRDIEGIFSDV